MTGDASTLLRILLVEDDSLDRASLMRALRNDNHGFYITEASSINTACVVLESHHFDVILTEYQLYDGNADTLLAQVTAPPCERPPAIIMGSYRCQMRAGQCFPPGA